MCLICYNIPCNKYTYVYVFMQSKCRFCLKHFEIHFSDSIYKSFLLSEFLGICILYYWNILQIHWLEILFVTESRLISFIDGNTTILVIYIDMYIYVYTYIYIYIYISVWSLKRLFVVIIALLSLQKFPVNGTESLA